MRAWRAKRVVSREIAGIWKVHRVLCTAGKNPSVSPAAVSCSFQNIGQGKASPRKLQLIAEPLLSDFAVKIHLVDLCGGKEKIKKERRNSHINTTDGTKGGLCPMLFLLNKMKKSFFRWGANY